MSGKGFGLVEQADLANEEHVVDELVEPTNDNLEAPTSKLEENHDINASISHSPEKSNPDSQVDGLASRSARSRAESMEAVVLPDALESPQIPVIESAVSPVIEEQKIEKLPEENFGAQEPQANENPDEADILAPMKRVPKVYNKQSNVKLLKPVNGQNADIGPKEMTKPAPIKKVIAVRFDSEGDSVHDGDYSDEKTKKDCKKESSAEVKAAKHKLNMIDPKNQPSLEKREEESAHESDDDDGIPLITIPLGKVLEEYYKKMRKQAASSEYSYEDQKPKSKEVSINDKLMKQIRNNVLDISQEEASESL